MTPVCDEPNDVEQPFPVGTQGQVAGTGTSKRGRDLGALNLCGPGEALSDVLALCRHLDRLTTLGVHHGDQSDVGQF